MKTDQTQDSRLDQILAFHNGLIENESKRPERKFWRISGWSSEISQPTRFHRLLQACAYSGGQVLDWGSGPGDLYGHLETLAYPFQYAGVDVNPTMIRISCERFGPLFRHVDLSYRPTASYDYVFASGIFQFKDLLEPEYYLAILEHMYSCARRAVAVNFLSAARPSEQKADRELYVDATELCTRLVSISPNWLVDHSYHPGFGDFTVALLRPDPKLQWNKPNFARPR